MKSRCIALFATLALTGCGGEQAVKTSAATSKAVTSISESHLYPRLEWTEPLPENSELLGGWGSTNPANLIVLGKCFRAPLWRASANPQFTVNLNEDEYFRITIDPDSRTMVGTVKTTKSFDMGGSVERTRTTRPFANEDEAFSLLEAYMNQDGAFEELVQWSDEPTTSG